jgi:hypothetical protein
MREEEVLRTSLADLALSRRIHTKAKFAAVIFGHRRPPRAVMCSWQHGIQFLQMLGIFELKAASRAVGDPSGVVPSVVDGGRCLISPKSTGDDEEGLFGLVVYFSSVLFVKVEDLYGKTLCNRGLFVTFTAT